NARDACHDNSVAAREQRAGGGEPQTLDLFVDRGVFLDVGVGARDISFRLVVIEVADEVFDRVAWEELLELGVKLRGERLVMRDHKRRPIDLANYVCNRKSFSRTSHAEQRLMAIACFDGLDQLGDRL